MEIQTISNINNLIIEVTRKCNLNCEHCLRGCSENVVFDTKLFPSIFKNVQSINNITFTGGEPSLHPEIIVETVKYLKNNDIPLSFFFIATNATFYNPKFILALFELYDYCYDKDLCALAVSIDQFHDKLNYKAYDIYKSFTFYSDSKEFDKEREEETIISRGNALNNGIGDKRATEKTEICSYDYEYDWDRYNSRENVSFEEIYVSANGNITLDCDFSYDMIDSPEYNIGCISQETALIDIITEKIKDFENDNIEESA